MSGSFDELFGIAAPKKKSLLRTDWSAEEKVFSQRVNQFKSSLAETCLVSPLKENLEEKGSKEEGKRAFPVESDIVRLPVGNPIVSTTGPNEEQKAEQHKAEPQMQTKDPEKRDPFDFESSEPVPLQSAQSPQGAQTTAVDDFFSNEPAKQSDPRPVVQEEDHKKAAAPPTPQTLTILPADPLEGFNSALFEIVQKTAYAMMEGIPLVDLDRILGSLPEYSVNMGLDHYRENLDVLNEKIIKIEGMRDSLFSQTQHLSALSSSAEEAAEYMLAAGMACSNASNKEKREAQIRLADPQFWIRYAKVCRTDAAVEATFKHLSNQYETISRLTTLLQIRVKVAEISRGEVPFERKEEKIQQPQQSTQTEEPKKQKTEAKTEPEVKKADLGAEPFSVPITPPESPTGEIPW